jgi:two-component system sensor histidine kinase UhpB
MERAVRGRGRFTCDYRVKLADGVHTFYAVGEIVARDSGQPTRLAGTTQDVTERVKAEAQRERLLQKVSAAREQLQNLSLRLLQAQEDERRRLAGELHDEIGQVLTAVSLSLEAIDGNDILAQLEDSKQAVGRAIEQVRGMSLNLRPAMLDLIGLESALRWLVERQSAAMGAAFDLHCDLGAERLAPELESACFRIVQEAITNIARHAGAGHVRVEVTRSRASVHLSIHDDGIGFDPAAAKRRARNGGSFGVLGMEDRARLLGGILRITSAPGKGTTIRVRLPLQS